tara:strand:+ start:157 stop:819 length:663 start_codon:yes stop_codon:yes gene_type:complete
MAAKYWLAGNPNAEISNAEVTALGELDATELDLLDGSSGGTVVASKAVIYDGNGSILTTGIINNNITEGTGTSAVVDLSSTRSSLVWYANTVQAGAITLPDATSSNAGMVITIIVGTASWSTTAFKLGFANSGTCVLVGQILLSALDGAAGNETCGFTITANAQSLEIDADDATAAGGAIGSKYVFTYLEEDLVHCMAYGMCTTGTPAPDAAASTTSGTA